MLNTTRRAVLSAGAAALVIKPANAQAFWPLVAGFFIAKELSKSGESTFPPTANQTAAYQPPKAVAAIRVKSPYRIVGVPAIPQPDAEHPEDPLIAKIAERLLGDADLAAQVFATIGRERAEMFLAGKIGLWTQFNNPILPNMLKVRLHNNSMETVWGAIEFAIDNYAGKREFAFVDDGYKMEPHGTLETVIPLRIDFLTPGVKKVTIINQPREVICPACAMYVLPFTIQAA